MWNVVVLIVLSCYEEDKNQSDDDGWHTVPPNIFHCLSAAIEGGLHCCLFISAISEFGVHFYEFSILPRQFSVLLRDFSLRLK